MLCPENGLNLFSKTKSGQLKCDLSVSFDEPGTEHIIRMTYEGQCLKVIEHLVDTNKKIDTCVVSRLCKISDQTDPNMELEPMAMDTVSLRFLSQHLVNQIWQKIGKSQTAQFVGSRKKDMQGKNVSSFIKMK